MSELTKAREAIDRIDGEMARLFEERMREVEAAMRYKAEHRLPILDPSRENEVIARNLALIDGEALLPYYRRYLEGTMAISRAYQASLINAKKTNVITVHTPSREYPVFFVRNGIARADECFDLNRRVLILTDDGVPAEYASAVACRAKEPLVYTVKQGEKAKSLAVLEKVGLILLQNGFTREDCIVAVGGGVVGDLGGLAASLFMRGIDFYNVPTTSLSAIDSSVGGKTAVNLGGVKNTLGTFYQPSAVLVDANTLRTLDSRQMRSGLCEAVKMAACFDPELFAFLEENEITNENIEQVLYRSVKIKATLVALDERDGGARKLLNFGHTLGHAIESGTGLHSLTHGECVGLGMLPMAEGNARDRIERVLRKLSLPTMLPCSPQEILRYAKADKKRAGNTIDCITLKEIGKAEIVPMTTDEFYSAVTRCYGKGEGR